MRPGDVVHESPDREIGVDRHRVAHHQVAYSQTIERCFRRDIARLRAGGLEQEPADEREPRSAERSLEDEHRDPEADEQVAETPADAGGYLRRPSKIASAPPERCP